MQKSNFDSRKYHPGSTTGHAFYLFKKRLGSFINRIINKFGSVESFVTDSLAGKTFNNEND